MQLPPSCKELSSILYYTMQDLVQDLSSHAEQGTNATKAKSFNCLDKALTVNLRRT